jgi:hypothetical protein
MKVSCQHGFFKFWEAKAGQISDFISTYGFDLISENDYFTFSFLSDAPKYSIAGGEYLGALATKTFEGEPWEVMRENNLVYDFNLDKVVLIETIIQPVQLKTTDRYILADGMILPGSLTDAGERVTDYAAFYLFDSVKFKYSEVTVE